MKSILTFSASHTLIFNLLCLLSLLLFFGCSDTEDTTGPAESLPMGALFVPTNSITGPSPDWYKTADPELFVQQMRAQLIKQFGDIPAVHTFADLTLKELQWIPLTLDEMVAYLNAQYLLWPSENTLKSLKLAREMKAKGATLRMIYTNAPDEVIVKTLEEFEGRTFGKHEVALQLKIARAKTLEEKIKLRKGLDEAREKDRIEAGEPDD